MNAGQLPLNNPEIRSIQMAENLLDIYATIIATSCYGIVLVKAETGQIAICNEQFLMQSGEKAQNLIGTQIWEAVPPELKTRTKTIFNKMLLKDEITGQQHFTGCNNASCYLEYSSQRLNLNDGIYVQIIIKDITRYIKREHSLKASVTKYKIKLNNLMAEYESTRTQLKEYSHKLHEMTNAFINAKEDERKIIAIELHDRVAQDLISLGHQIESLRHISAYKDTSDIEELAKKAREALSSTRDIMKTLYPISLTRYGLIETIAQELNDFEATSNVSTRFKSCLTIKLDPAIENTLYRIFHEALLNIQKHSLNAHNVTVLLEKKGQTVEMKIRDDGDGFNIQNISGKEPRGLEIMRQRALLLGGSFGLESFHRNGTEIWVTIPVDGLSA
ncbi:MAG: ATPase [Dehalococcoides mccartyi]|nr:ATPase [Dehalococcoides mccartyi]MEA2122376.1 hypothetical protein [Dehalococcoides mccartyi]